VETLKSVLKKIDTIVFTLTRHFCAIVLGALVAVVFYIFFGRYALNKSPMWGEPFSLLCLVWLSLLGSALVVRKNEHLRVTMFDDILGKKGVFVTDVLSFLCVLIFSIFLIVYGIKLAQSGASNNMAGINVPYAVMYASMPVTGVLNIFGLIGNLVETIEKGKEGEE
jgi:TRAP-type C4-dicarboxylate transport system permease small subunit